MIDLHLFMEDNQSRARDRSFRADCPNTYNSSTTVPWTRDYRHATSGHDEPLWSPELAKWQEVCSRSRAVRPPSGRALPWAATAAWTNESRGTKKTNPVESGMGNWEEAKDTRMFCVCVSCPCVFRLFPSLEHLSMSLTLECSDFQGDLGILSGLATSKLGFL